VVKIEAIVIIVIEALTTRKIKVRPKIINNRFTTFSTIY
jgi:hypothetical protein